ncbi:MAG: hypothetical protein L0322_16405 [Chloroflexi bacterium]|nr:hypothetical protein [Chloroflexota bacterium]MCI0649866.1 hypothetical protein [Chloroflexota bacterium]
MKIELSRKEYRLLIDMLYIAEWVLNSFKVEDDPTTRPYDRLEQKLYAYAKEAGLENLIEYYPEDGLYFPTRGLEESGVHDIIDEYDDETFWSELTNRLAWRDLARQVGGEEKVRQLSLEERLGKLFELEEHYQEILAEKGLDSITVA